MSLKLILGDIQRALTAGAPYAALAATVTLPEICGRCELDDPFSTKGPNRSEALFSRFVTTYLPNWPFDISGEDLFHLRNAISHKGGTTQRNNPLRYVFHPPSGQFQMSNNKFIQKGQLRYLDIDLQEFCTEISNAVLRWEEANRGNEQVQRNLDKVLQVREGSFGLPYEVEGLVHIA